MNKVLFVVGFAFVLACGGQSPPPEQTPSPGPTADEPMPPPPAPSYDRITLTGVPYYASGPMQDRPPDGEIPAGVPCRVLDGSIGPYAEIETGDGTHGWVAADALGPNPPP